MATRDYRGVRLNSGATVAPEAAAPIRVGQLRQQDTSRSIADDALLAIVGEATQFATQNFERSVQEHYVQGQRAASQKKAVEEVDADPFMAPFVRGGYNDANWQAKQAELSSKLQQYIATEGKMLDSDAFAQKMAEEFAPLLDDYKGLTGQMQGRALASQAQLEATLLETQAKENAKWSLESYAQRVSMRGNETATSILKARKSGDVLAEEGHVARAYQFVSDVLKDPKLTEDTRNDVVVNYLQMLANSDIREVPESLRLSGALDGLDSEQLTKLDTAIRESQNRTRTLDNHGAYEYMGQIEARLEAGDMPDKDEFQSYLDFGVRELRRSDEWVSGQWRKYYSQGNDPSLNRELLAAWASGDRTAVVAHLPPGADVGTAGDIYNKYLAKAGIPAPQRIADLVSKGVVVGSIPKSVGREFMAAVNSVAMTDGDAEVNPEHAEVLRLVTDAVALNEADRPYAGATLLQAIPEEGRSLVSFMMRVRDTIPPTEALRIFRAKGAEFEKMDENTRRARSVAVRTALREQAAKEWGNGRFVSGLVNVVGGMPQIKSEWANDMLYDAMQQEVLAKAADPTTVALFGTPELEASAVENAYASVLERVIPVGVPGVGGKPAIPLILPRGVRVEDAFPGITAADAMRLGENLAKTNPFEHPLPEDSLVGYFMRAGSLWAVELDADGEEKLGGAQQRVSKQFMGEIIAKTREESRQVWEEQDGARLSKPVNVSAGPDGRVQFRMSGENAYGLNPVATYKWRKELLSAEGLRLAAYNDASGVAVGVGRNVTKQMQVGDRVTVEQAEQWFREDSDAAIRDAQRLAIELGVRSEEAVLGLAGMTYQHGSAGVREWKRTMEIIKNPEKYSYSDFIEEARNSDTWRNPQTRKRVEMFIQRMKPHWE